MYECAYCLQRARLKMKTINEYLEIIATFVNSFLVNSLHVYLFVFSKDQ